MTIPRERVSLPVDDKEAIMSSSRLAGCVLALLVCWSSGCDNQQSQTVETPGGAHGKALPLIELVAQARPPIPDLPVPIGFNLDEGRSRNFAAGGARYVDHLYKGRADKFAVARFYKRHMPISRWVLMTDMFAQGDIMLVFEKETQRCQIIASDGSLWHPCYIQVQLWTTGRIKVPSQSGAKGASNK